MAHPERLGKVVNAQLAFGEQRDNPHARRIAERLEDARQLLGGVYVERGYGCFC